MAIELTQARGLEKGLLLLWKWFGDFGLSPGKSILWLVVFTAALWLVLMYGGTSIDESIARGWQKNLLGGEFQKQSARAFVGAIQNIVSPLTMFSPKKLIVPSNELGAWFQGIHSIATVGLVLLTGFSLRRRFKFK